MKWPFKRDTTKYAVVNTDNFGGDYPNEKFVGKPFNSHEDAKTYADELNKNCGNNAPRWHKVVALPYELQPGFEP